VLTAARCEVSLLANHTQPSWPATAWHCAPSKSRCVLSLTTAHCPQPHLGKQRHIHQVVHQVVAGHLLVRGQGLVPGAGHVLVLVTCTQAGRANTQIITNMISWCSSTPAMCAGDDDVGGIELGSVLRTASLPKLFTAQLRQLKQQCPSTYPGVRCGGHGPPG
jgi:hypothetical protein